MTGADAPRRALLFVESDTRGAGRPFVRPTGRGELVTSAREGGESLEDAAAGSWRS